MRFYGPARRSDGRRPLALAANISRGAVNAKLLGRGAAVQLADGCAALRASRRWPLACRPAPSYAPGLPPVLARCLPPCYVVGKQHQPNAYRPHSRVSPTSFAHHDCFWPAQYTKTCSKFGSGSRRSKTCSWPGVFAACWGASASACKAPAEMPVPTEEIGCFRACIARPATSPASARRSRGP